MIKKILILLVAVLMISAVALTAAGPGKGPGNGSGSGVCRFIDENGDGINDNFRDHDGDGIPNHDDPDWTRPQDGSGYQNGWQHRNSTEGRRAKRQNGNGHAFRNVHRFGDGVCDGNGPQNLYGFQNRGNGRRGGRS